MIVTTPFDYAASWRGRHNTIIELGPEDFPQLDQPQVVELAPAHNKGTARRWTIAGQWRTNHSHYWGHIRNNQHLTEVIRDGWSEGAEKIIKLSDKLRALVPMPVGTRRKLRWSDQGDEVEMHRVYTGQLDQAWRSYPRQRDRAPRVISIDVDIGHNNNVSSEDLFWSGAAAVALTDALELAGYRVELFATWGSAHGSGHTLTRFRAKAANQSCSPTSVAALVALPATFRYYGLISNVLHSGEVGCDFGHATDVRPMLDACARQAHICLSEYLLTGVLSEQRAVEVCKAAIAQLTAEQDAGQGTMR